jgi:hypothetical protein
MSSRPILGYMVRSYRKKNERKEGKEGGRETGRKEEKKEKKMEIRSPPKAALAHSKLKTCDHPLPYP